MKKNKLIDKYQELGFCHVKKVFSKKQIQKIQQSIIDRTNLDFDTSFKLSDFNKGSFHNFLIKKRKENPKQFSKFYSILQTNINVFSITSSEKLKNHIKNLLNIKKDYLSCSDFLFRTDAPKDKRNSLDWHQDSSYFKRTEDLNDCCVIWIPIQRIDNKIGPLNMIPSSHLFGGLPFNRIQKNLLSSPQNKIAKKYYSNKKVVKFKMSVGDVILMDSKVIHRSGKNISNKFRFTILSRIASTLNKTFIPGRLVYQKQDEYNKKLLKR